MPAFNGTSAPDTFVGDGTSDTFIGAAGGDTLSGDLGFDLFILGDGDSPAVTAVATPTAIDVITDWTAQDRLLFLGAQAPIFGSLGTGVADDYQGAYDQAGV